MHSTDFKLRAREALRGKWKLAVCVGLVASLLGASTATSFEFTSNLDFSDPGINLDAGGAEFVKILAIILLVATPFMLAMICVSFSLGCIIDIGYSRFNLRLIDNEESSFNDLFAYFSKWKTAVVAGLLKFVYIFLWSLLFIIPGVIASLNYALTSYIIAENDDLSAGEALEESKELMYGNRWKLFCLHFSFIGWDILNLFTFGLGSLWLVPYKSATIADFYREISETRKVEEPIAEEPTSFDDTQI